MKNEKFFWKALNKGYHFIDFIRNILIIFLFSFVIVICFINVILRYSPSLKSLFGTEELLRHMNIWLVFLASSIAIKQEVHLVMEYFLKFFQEKHRVVIAKIRNIIILIFLVIFIVFGTQKTIENIPQWSQDIHISIAWTYLAIPVGCLFMFIDQLLITIYGHHPFKKIKKEE